MFVSACRFSGQDNTERKQSMESILWCILSADVAAWTADRQKGHPSPFIIVAVVAGATVQLSEGHSNKSLSPPGPLAKGRDPRVRAGQGTGSPKTPRSGGNQRDEGEVATISGFTDT